MHITPEMMEATYRLLLTTLPFRRWKLPHPDNVEFNVSLHRDRRAHHCAYKDGVRHEVVVSAREVKTLSLLTETMGHEMIHIRQDQLGLRDHHGASFKHMAALACRRHGWDLVNF